MYSTEAIIRSNESEEEMPCIVTGCNLDGTEDDGFGWFPVWHMDGAVYLGMNCGNHKHEGDVN